MLVKGSAAYLLVTPDWWHLDDFEVTLERIANRLRLFGQISQAMSLVSNHAGRTIANISLIEIFSLLRPINTAIRHL